MLATVTCLLESQAVLAPTDYEEARAGSDARGNIGSDTLPLPMVLLAERFEL